LDLAQQIKLHENVPLGQRPACKISNELAAIPLTSAGYAANGDASFFDTASDLSMARALGSKSKPMSAISMIYPNTIEGNSTSPQ